MEVGVLVIQIRISDFGSSGHCRICPHGTCYRKDGGMGRLNASRLQDELTSDGNGTWLGL